MGDIWDLPSCAQVKSVFQIRISMTTLISDFSMHQSPGGPVIRGLRVPGVSVSVRWVWAGSASAFLTSSLEADSVGSRATYMLGISPNLESEFSDDCWGWGTRGTTCSWPQVAGGGPKGCHVPFQGRKSFLNMWRWSESKGCLEE